MAIPRNRSVVKIFKCVNLASQDKSAVSTLLSILHPPLSRLDFRVKQRKTMNEKASKACFKSKLIQLSIIKCIACNVFIKHELNSSPERISALIPADWSLVRHQLTENVLS